ncbi:MAG: GGDEF domain-containing protein [Sandaracinus sp.]|nr:GGDEF domain-containing protein [Sandaracinus sp.]
MGEWDDEETKTVVGGRDAILAAVVGPKAVSRDRAYVIVIAGPNVGEMFKVSGLTEVGRGQTVGIRIHDTEISRRHARLTVEGDRVLVEDLGSTNGTFVNGQPIDKVALSDGDKIQVGTTTILKFSYHDDLDEQFQRHMYEAALRDGLTGAYNKKYLSDRMESELAYAARHRSPLSLVIFDLDHFKKINDTYGHLAGDYVLRAMAEGINATVRKEDVFARYGGEEFAVLSRGIDQPSAQQFAERLRQWVELYPFIWESQRIPVTCSIGVAAFPELDLETPIELVKAADDALYAAKNGGRNRVVVASP